MALTFNTEADLEQGMFDMFDYEVDRQKSKKDFGYRGLPLLSASPGTSLIRVYKQPNLQSYGRCDLIIIESYLRRGVRHIDIDVIELKNTPISAEHVGQISRYCVGINVILASVSFSRKTSVRIKLHLVGTSFSAIENSDQVYTVLCGRNLHLYSYHVSAHSGLMFSSLKKADKEALPVNSDSIVTIAVNDLLEEAREARGIFAATVNFNKENVQ